MNAAQIVFGLSSANALCWLWKAVESMHGMKTLPDLTRRNSPLTDLSATQGPDVTVIVPACNEEESIAAMLHSLLASTSVRLQIVAVNDRSTDRTGELMDAVASEARASGCGHTLEVIHNGSLLAGWLGKTHALALAAHRAKAPWLLFTDGDVRLDPRAVALGLSYAQAECADHVILAFTLEIQSIAEAAVLAAFQAIASWRVRLWKVADPKARDFFGAGGFNLVRREVYERLGGFEALRMEVLEDLRLGWMIKRAGYAQRVALGKNLVRIRWIKGALGIVNLLEKNGFAAVRYRLGAALLGLCSMAICILLPFAAIAVGGWTAWTGILTYVFMAAHYAANRRVTQVSPWLAVLFAPAAAILLFALARSTFLALRRDGVVWRGTHYPLDELRRNAGDGW